MPTGMSLTCQAVPRLQIQYSQGISLLIARLDALGLIQYADNASNTVCNFFRTTSPKREGWNYDMKCRDFCAWESGKRHCLQHLPLQPICPCSWMLLPCVPRARKQLQPGCVLSVPPVQVRDGLLYSLGWTSSSGHVSMVQ